MAAGCLAGCIALAWRCYGGHLLRLLPGCSGWRPPCRQWGQRLLIFIGLLHMGAGRCYLLDLRRVFAGRLAVHAARACAAITALHFAAAALRRTCGMRVLL